MTNQTLNASNQQQLSLLLPSKGRFLDLILTLLFTRTVRSPEFSVKFVICANYNRFQIALLRTFFASRALVIDERKEPAGSMIGAYNLAFEYARKAQYTWVALWADDLLPASNQWLSALVQEITAPDFKLGIFSSDEGGHKGKYGWNIFAGYPCAHFYIARTDALPGYLLNPKLSAYVGDNEIVIDRIKAKIDIKLLSIKVVHQPTINSTRKRNAQAYANDLQKMYAMHPELTGRLDSIVLNGNLSTGDSTFVADQGKTTIFSHDTPTLPYAEFISQSPEVQHRLTIRLIGTIRVIWNRIVLLTEILVNKIA